MMERRVKLTRPRVTQPPTLVSKLTCEPCHDYKMATTHAYWYNILLKKVLPLSHIVTTGLRFHRNNPAVKILKVL